MFRKMAISAAVSSLLISSNVWSLGLGEIKSETKLNQPLSAKIQLLSSKSYDQKDLRAKVASFEAYNKFGVVRDSSHSAFKFKTVTLADGSKQIQVTSNEPMKEPFVNVLIELNWPQGRLLREYTILLDPPAFSKAAPVNVVPTKKRESISSRSRVKSKPVKPKNNVRSNTPTSSTRVQPKAQVKATARTSTKVIQPKISGNSLRVGRGNTLWSIATRVRPDGASIQQTLAALYRSNSSAFINNDIDKLKAGHVLKLPDAQQVAKVPRSIDYNDLRKDSPSNKSTPLDVRKTVEETKVNDNAATGGRLTIASVEQSSLNEQGGSSLDTETNSNLQSEADSLAEAVETLKLQNENLREQLTESQNVSETGLSVEDETLSVLAGSAEAKEDEETGLPKAIESSKESAEELFNKTLEEALDNTTNNDIAEKKVEEVLPTQNTLQPAEEDVGNASPSFWQKDGFLTWLLIGLGALLALVGGWFFVRKQQASSNFDISSPDESFEPSIESKVSDSGNARKRSAITDSDPLIEADILLARGRLNKVKKLLIGAINKEPTNIDLRLKLMEVYASSGEKGKFEALKAKLPANFDHDSAQGLKLASLAASLSSAGSSALNTNRTEGKPPVLPSQEKALEKSKDEFEPIELDKGLNADTEALDEFHKEQTKASKTIERKVESMLEKGEELVNLSDTSDEQMVDVMNDANPRAVNIPVDKEDDLAFALNDNDSQHQQGEDVTDDEVETKLELARAYVDMGDDESARDVLLEVQKEGNTRQRKEAEQLLGKV